ncbi:MAG: TRAP transporter small permease [Eubacteriales bacterium]|nr:TRAP transporter small permease [Eubacteriales bacterium]
MKGYSKFLDGLEKVEKFILVVTIGLMVVIMLYQVIMRYVFSKSNAWSEELTRYLFILNVMLASAVAVRSNSHLQIDVFLNKMHEKTKAGFTIVSTILGIIFLFYLLKASIDVCRYTVNNISAGLHFTMAIPYASIPIGAVLMILSSIEVIGKNVQKIRNSEAIEPKEGENV